MLPLDWLATPMERRITSNNVCAEFRKKPKTKTHAWISKMVYPIQPRVDSLTLSDSMKVILNITVMNLATAKKV